jgi:DNA segregation ATPase FtsK/SpoIIIE-like protein
MTARLGVVVESPLFPPVPALVLCPEHENLLIKASGAGKERAVRALQSFMLRLLTLQPPGKLRFTLIDSSGLGENLAAFLQLTDYDPLLIGAKVWTRKEHIIQQLAEISDHMENVIQQYLRNQFQTIGEYNLAAGEIAEPYRVLVVVGFPTHFTRETADQLTHIATAGPRCGVSVLMTVDTKQPLPANVRLTELERISRVITEDGQGFTWQQQELGACRIQLDQLPAPALVNYLLKRVGEKALQAQQRVEIPFRVAVERRVIPEYRWWLPDQQTSEEVTVPLGQLRVAKYQYIQLGKGTAHHVLIVGTTGSGKTNLLHVLITGLSLLYHPNELEFYLIDFKTVGFTPYAHYKLPHARVIAVQSEREFGLSVLEGVKNELEERKRLFSQAYVQDIAQFRRVQPHTRMPRILLVIDEFQELFMRQDEIALAAGEHLNRFVRMGRGLGIHVILASQTLAALSSRTSILDNATLSQMTVRIAMHKERGDSALILGEENAAAAHLFQLRPGEAIYNADGGAEGSNRRFQSFFLADEELSIYLDAVRHLAQNRNVGIPLAQRIFDGSRNADVAQNRALKSLLHAPGWQDRRWPTIWLGDPVSLQEVTAVQLRPRTGSNLLILGREESVASGLLTLAFFALAAQHAPGKARFYILDGRADSPYIDRLRNREQELPHSVQGISRSKLSGFLTEICDEIQDRIEEEAIEAPPVYLFVHGLQRLRALRLEEKDSLAQQLATIAREGAEQHIHLLLWCDTLHNLARSMEYQVLSEFELRVAFHMSEKDSLQFLGSPEASRLNPYRAVFLSHGEGVPEKFIPYAAPSDEWLVEAVERLRQKTGERLV